MTRLLLPFLASLAAAPTLTAGTKLLQSFEGDGFGDWQVDGPAFGMAPVVERTEEMNASFRSQANESFACSAHGGDASTGTLTSPEFVLSEPYITFLIAGGDQPGKTAAQLLIDGKVVREATGKRDLEFRPVVWDIREFAGQKATIRLIDDATGGWGIIAVDHVLLTDYPNQKFPPSTRDGKPKIGDLVAAQVVPGISIPGATDLSVIGTSKDKKIISPTALAFDEQGRIYIAETHRFRFGVEDNRDNLYWFHDDISAQNTADRLAMHKKWDEKRPMHTYTEKSEIIRRLADTNGDGTYDESKVFAEDFDDVLDGTAAGVFVYEDTVYFACIPKLWMLRDTNGDGTADERKVIEDGFGVRVSFSGHDMNGFALGPDGRIYGTIGDRGFSVTTKEGKTFHYPDQGATFRFEPDGSGFEIVHLGLRNPKEIAFDEFGNAFSVDNNSDQGDAARVVYIVEGGDSGWEMGHQSLHSFHRQIGLENRPPNRWMDENMWKPQNDGQPAWFLPPIANLTSGPSGLTYHPGTGFLESEAGRFLICDYRGGASNSGITSFSVKPEGAGMKLENSRPLTWGVAATDVEYSWDGQLYITDFIGGWASHEDGRLLKLSAGDYTWRAEEAADAAKVIREGFDQRDSGELARLLKHEDFRVRLRAQLALTRKADALERFTAASASGDAAERRHGIWGLGILARRGSGLPSPSSDGFVDLPNAEKRKAAAEKLVPLLEHEDAETRAQAINALGDSPLPGDALPFSKLLLDESHRVRFFAGIAAGKLKPISAFDAVCKMLAENDNRDPYLRHAGSFALAGLVTNPTQLRLLARHESPGVRMGAVIALRRLKHELVADFVHDSDTRIADEAIRAINDLPIDSVRPVLSRLLDTLDKREWTPFMLRRLVHNAYRNGTPEDAGRLIKVAANDKLPEPVRKEAIRLLTMWTDPYPADQFTGEWAPLEKRDPAQLRPVLTAALPDLLRKDGFVLTSALELIDHYDLDVASLDDETLGKIVTNGKLPAAARAKGLELLIERAPEGIETTLEGLARDAADEVALSALSALAASSPDKAVPALQEAIEGKSVHRAQQAWGILAPLSGESATDVFLKHLNALKEAEGISPTALELIAAAKQRGESTVSDALAALEKTLAESKDPLARWHPSLEGGDAEAGASLFNSHPAGQCMRCHRAEDGHKGGGEAGPNLAGIGKRKERRYFLESMVAPSAAIAPGYGAVSITLSNGATLGGNLLAETDEHVDIDSSGKLWRVKRTDIADLTQPVSAMPPMAALLSPGELRDLVAWMASLEKGGDTHAAKGEPEVLDPTTLAAPETEAAPAEETPAETTASPTTDTIDPATLKAGQQQFMLCAACHGQNGEGGPAGPPLAGSEWVTGPVENLIRIQLRGLQGPIKVKGMEYNMVMAPMAFQTDEQIASVLTHVRNSFGNKAPAVTPEQVAALRDEAGKPMLTVADLLPPVAETKPEAGTPDAGASASPEARQSGGKYDDLRVESGIPVWVYGIGLAVAALLVFPLFKRK